MMTATADLVRAASPTDKARAGIAFALHLADSLGIASEVRNLVVYLDTWGREFGEVDVDVRFGAYALGPAGVDAVADREGWPWVASVGSNFCSRAGLYEADGLRVRVEVIATRPVLTPVAPA